MPDMLVKLLELPPVPVIDGVTIRRPRAYERSAVARFVNAFGGGWADEFDTGFGHFPPSVFIATIGGTPGAKTAEIVGFAAYDCTARGFFGPTGVSESQRGRGVGKALLIAALHAMREVGYVYAIIGGVGPADFYAKTVGAVIIDDGPGLYSDLLKP
ncbi:MAG: GNAT family N-acetyltransferase [Planctomycetota bacterium]